MKKKGAIELSMTTIIVIVLGVTLLTLGIVWIKGLGSSLQETTKEAFRVSQDEISKIGLRDQKLYIPGGNKEIKIGGSLKFEVYVQNFLGKDEKIKLVFEGDGADWFKTAIEASIPAGETFKFPVVVNAPKTIAAGEVKIITIKALKSDGSMYDQDAITLEITE